MDPHKKLYSFKQRFKRKYKQLLKHCDGAEEML